MPGPVVVPKLLTMDELAERLGVTPRHIRQGVLSSRAFLCRGIHHRQGEGYYRQAQLVPGLT
jgi:hypothetical protein